ncbi:MAG: glycosyl hydrolase family 35 [Firmicutes bacterium]|nr:glycosyl hydrolase family 35 [Bacillota bacterium]
MRTDGRWFRDRDGRVLMLRGVNLGGSTKVPSKPPLTSDVRQGFFEHRNISFVGRPFPLEEADEHFARLREWGFNFLRFLVTWEAIEHQGPGIYDQDYLDYVYKVAKKAGEYGFKLFVDPHQDVWSRFSGGDGAPGWTFEAVGLDITKFQDTGAAIVHNTHGDPFPKMIWPTNYTKLAAATMFTLFFGGNDFAPATFIDGEPVQEYLQRHYINSIRQVARKLKDLPHVVGFDTLNEPSRGYIGWQDLTKYEHLQKQGNRPTPWQSILLGAGYPQTVEVWKLGLTGMRRSGRRRINPEGQRVWLPGRDCIWWENGVWDLDAHGKPELLRADYFSHVNGRPVDFGRDYMNPFIRRFASEIRNDFPRALIFIEHEVMGEPAQWQPEETKNFVYAPHWYDNITLILKRYLPFLTIDLANGRPVIGRKKVQEHCNQELGRLKQQAAERINNVPTLVGEIGIPFDMHNKKAYRTNDFSAQIQALDRSMQALEANLLSFTLWNYTADNTNRRGDGWNGEDLSLFSRDQQHAPRDINSGGRALAAALRPWPFRVAGEPLAMHFDLNTRTYTLNVRPDPNQEKPTEIYVPRYHFGDGLSVKVSAGTWEYDSEYQTLFWNHQGSAEPATLVCTAMTDSTSK